MKRGAKKEVEPASVPAWVVSFGDMITNLLACFVMMQAFATTQDRTLFNAGMGSYRRAIEQCGLPDWLFGKKDGPEFDYRKIKYPTPNDDTNEDPNRSRIIDVQEDRIRQAFAKISEAMDTSGKPVHDKLMAPLRLNVRYAPDAVELDSAGLAVLKQTTATLRQGLAGQRVRLCIVGVVTGGSERNRWILSARRARRVEGHLRRELARDIRSGLLELKSWGAGEGKHWCKKVGMDRPQDSIILAIMKTGNRRG